MRNRLLVDHFNWRAYTPSNRPRGPFRLAQKEFQQYEVKLGGLRRPMPVYSMLSAFELAMIFGLAKDRWTGRGEIVDMGPYMGLTTWCFWNGMRLNRSVPARAKHKRLHVFDLFINYDGTHQSTFPTFLKLNGSGLRYLDAYPGDALVLSWSGKPVEVLFIDMAKSVVLQDHIVQQFFPTLVPDAMLVQQDYAYFDQYWIHILMEMFKDHFRLEELVYGASALYTLVKPLPDLTGWRLEEAASPQEQAALHRRHLEAAPENVRGVLWAAQAKLLLDQGRINEAEAALDAVAPTRDADPVQDFSAIAKSNREMVAALIKARVDGAP